MFLLCICLHALLVLNLDLDMACKLQQSWIRKVMHHSVLTTNGERGRVHQIFETDTESDPPLAVNG